MTRLQYWKIINIDKRHTIEFDSLRLSDILFSHEPTRLVWALARPRKFKPYQRSLKRGHSTDPHDLGALNLPFDILERIFQQFNYDDIADAVFLALTNSFLRDVGQNRVCELLRIEYSCPWHLARIACVGNRLAGDDFPPGVKEREKAQLGGRAYDRFLGANVPRLFIAEHALADKRFRGYLGKIFSPRKTKFLSPAERREMDSLLQPDFSWDGRPETEWILCNWTEAKYVRASGVARLTDSRCDGPWTDGMLSLGHVLLTQICWSSERSGAIDDKRGLNIHRGPWAGHYISITTVDQLTENVSYNCKQYVDVTDKILAEVSELWRDNDMDVLECAAESSESDDNEETFQEYTYSDDELYQTMQSSI
ncbi:uncharacterized protein B0H18DRAFT_952806 [Fomitopsis serialis]|uniref:uncharacterized protein n=1 Tax=Fomitopsis serialis TaxID=139415 RepID=UPI00200810D4|nr:uncharacterized protein B0H18DRAFT_952806 [Neoantrodia serialis]KAH9931298.1 hypothetical protein B0H18DRAFT_952806 [Neoantrodia serialis]